MGPEELSRLEEEACIIQNNVRAWLLRKHYKSMREAIRLLQMVWRERRASTAHSSSGGGGGSKTPPLQIPPLPPGAGKRSRMMMMHGSSNSSGGGAGVKDVESAANTLQNAARVMLARRQFCRIKRQTMASLVIQRHVKQWLRKNNVMGIAM